MVLYLDLLSVAALCRRRVSLPTPACPRFAVLVPAHDEEGLLPRLLASIFASDYPRALYDVHVVADNCTDHTAALAAAAGAIVHERRDAKQVGKGHALRWLVNRVRESGTSYDAFLFLDADSVISANFLLVMNQHLARGDRVIQSYYGVLNRQRSTTTALRHAGLALYNGLRPRGRDALGLSAGLHGNGMCFTAEVMERFGWEAFTLAEDVEFHLRLVEAGIKVRFAGEAAVLADMPASLRQSESQNVRWERGRLQLLRASGPRLLLKAVRRRDGVLFEAMAGQLVPPLSVLTGAVFLNLLTATVLGKRGPRRLATAVLMGQIGYVFTGLRLARCEGSIYVSLLRAPF
jgi:cellulose synthase/poly-beta-1,6-N-acetylglucosamine synthase-like glycosyltransferase